MELLHESSGRIVLTIMGGLMWLQPLSRSMDDIFLHSENEWHHKNERAGYESINSAAFISTRQDLDIAFRGVGSNERNGGPAECSGD